MASSTLLAVPVGDINGDGFTDVAVRITRPLVIRPNGYPWYNETDLVIFYGSTNGIVSSPQPVITPLHPTDPLMIVAPVAGQNANFAARRRGRRQR